MSPKSRPSEGPVSKPVRHFLIPVADVWELQKILFFFEHVDDYLSASQGIAVKGGVLFGAPVYLRPPEDRRGPVIEPGVACLLIAATSAGFVSASDQFGIETSLIEVCTLDPEHLAGEENDTPRFVNAAMLSFESLRDMLRRQDPDIPAIMEGRIRSHANAPSMTIDAPEAAVFYDPRGPEIEIGDRRVLLPLLEEQLGILLATAEGIANPYQRAMLVGLGRLAESLLRHRPDGIEQ